MINKFLQFWAFCSPPAIVMAVLNWFIAPAGMPLFNLTSNFSTHLRNVYSVIRIRTQPDIYIFCKIKGFVAACSSSPVRYLIICFLRWIPCWPVGSALYLSLSYVHPKIGWSASMIRGVESDVYPVSSPADSVESRFYVFQLVSWIFKTIIQPKNLQKLSVPTSTAVVVLSQK